MPREGKYAPSTLPLPATSVELCSANSSSDSVARPAGFQNAASPRPAAAVAVCPIPTACAPTGKTRNSAPALRGCAWAESWTAGMLDRTIIPAVQPSSILLERFRLIDQHDGDVIFDRVNQPAMIADESFGRWTQSMLQGSLASWADEDLEEIGSEAHEVAYPSRFSAGSLRRHFGSTFTRKSRKTRCPRSASILARAAAPRALMVRPPSPMTMPFWLSRSTYNTARIYTGSAPSRNSSISAATLYGSSSCSCSKAASRMNSAAKNRIGWVASSSGS